MNKEKKEQIVEALTSVRQRVYYGAPGYDKLIGQEKTDLAGKRYKVTLLKKCLEEEPTELLMETTINKEVNYTGDLDSLRKELQRLAGGAITWEEVEVPPYGFKFKSSIGGTIIWSPIRGRLLFTGGNEVLKKLWRARAHVDTDGYGEVFITYMENHGGRIQVCNQRDGRYQLQVTRAACNVSVILTVGEIKELIKELGRCTGEQG